MKKLRLRFVDDVDSRLKPEMRELGCWLRAWYDFPNPLEIRFVGRPVLVDHDGTRCALRWWQSQRGRETVTAEIAVGSFARNLREGGPEVAYPTVVAAVGRVVKYYYQAIRNAPQRKDFADRWGDKMIDAYVNGTRPPAPWTGARHARLAR